MKTNAHIVLTIFGNERCVVMLDALEAAAHAIHLKAVREREASAHPSTLGAEIDGPIRPINVSLEHPDVHSSTNHVAP